MTATGTTAARTRWTAILAVGFAQLVVAGGTSGAAVALPAIRTDFAITESATAWVLLAYALPMSAIAIAAGRLADRADPRLLAALSVGGLALGSAAAAIAPTFPLLLAARAAGGLIGGLLFGITGRIVVTAAPEGARGRAMAAITLLMTIGGMGMVALGGLIVGATSWQGLFWVFAASAAALAAVLATIPGSGTGLPRPDRPLIVDTLTAGGAITAFLLAFEYADTAPPVAAGALAASIALGAVWARQPSSLDTVALLRRPAMAGALVSLVLMAVVTGLVSFSLPFLLTDVHRLGPESVGTVLLAFIGGSALVTPLAGLLADRFGPGRIALAGAALLMAAIVPLLLVDADTGLIDLGVRVAVLGAVFALFNTPINAFLLAAAPTDQAGTAGAFMATTRTVGSSLGPVVAAFAWGLGATALDGYRYSAWTIAAVLVCGVAAMAFARPWRRPTV